jgi:AraC-like DNA-binding protein
VVGHAATVAVPRRGVAASTATSVGFESLSGFDRVFLRLTGERPVDHRRRIRDVAMRDGTDVR